MSDPSFEPIQSSADQIGSLRDRMESECLNATNTAFNALAKACELRQTVRESYINGDENPVFLYAPFVCTSGYSPFKPVVNLVRVMRAQYLESKASHLLPPTE